VSCVLVTVAGSSILVRCFLLCGVLFLFIPICLLVCLLVCWVAMIYEQKKDYP
jgi:hypothetical protein